MQTIKFRGKSLNTGNWVFGDLRQSGKRKFVEYEVNPDTVGQFVGLWDNNGKEVYEHDYISINLKYEYHTLHGTIPDQDCVCEGEVVYMDCFACFGLRLYKAEYPISRELEECPYLTMPLLRFDLECESIEVFGNVFDNPELLK